MRFLWPWFLLLLLMLPAVVAVYLWILRRKRRLAVRYSSLSLIRQALPKRASWRRHLPFAIFLSALASLSLAIARPSTEVEVPLTRTTIILAIDVSRSMCATDVEPNRLTVAQKAALAFVEELSGGTRLGIVAFADLAQLVVPPTTDKEVLRRAIENLTTSTGTAIGSATLASVNAIAQVNPDVSRVGVSQGAVQPGAEQYQPDIIVLLTDGANRAASAAGCCQRLPIGFASSRSGLEPQPGPMVLPAAAKRHVLEMIWEALWRRLRRRRGKVPPFPAAGRANAAGRCGPDRRRLLPRRKRRSAVTGIPQPAGPNHAAETGGGIDRGVFSRRSPAGPACGCALALVESIPLTLPSGEIPAWAPP
jgi:hypothetical protein